MHPTTLELANGNRSGKLRTTELAASVSKRHTVGDCIGEVTNISATEMDGAAEGVSKRHASDAFIGNSANTAGYLRKKTVAAHAKGSRRDQRFGLLSTLQAITTRPRTQACGWRRINRHNAPKIVLQNGVAHVAGTQRCGSVWHCPICAPKIRQARAEELDVVLREWLDGRDDGSVQLWTLTQPHTNGEPLAMLRATIKAAWRQICSGRAWQGTRERFGISYQVTALDVTHGPNGWHPHLHVLVLTETKCSDEQIKELHAYVLKQWTKVLASRKRATPHPIHGVQIERARSRKDIGKYLCQVIGETDDDSRAWGVAQETVRTDLKQSQHPGHRTPWQILQSIRDLRATSGEWSDVQEKHDQKNIALWHEYEIAMTGARAVSFSKGLRAAVGLDAEKSDEELALEGDGGIEITEITSRADWLAVRLTRGGMVRLLRVAESHGERGVHRLIRRMRKRKQDHPQMQRILETVHTTDERNEWTPVSTSATTRAK